MKRFLAVFIFMIFSFSYAQDVVGTGRYATEETVVGGAETTVPSEIATQPSQVQEIIETEEIRETTDEQQQQSPIACLGGGGIEGILPLVGMVAIFYFLIIRPQQKQQKKLRKLRGNLGRGDKIVTTGGVHGIVSNIKDDKTIIIKIADNVKIEIDREAVGTVISSTGENQ